MKINLLILISFLSVFNLNSQIEPNPLFSDNMILQRNSDVNVWGKADKGKELSLNVSWSDKTYTTKVNNDGSWRLNIATPSAGGPYQIDILCNHNVLKIKNVMIGEVWVASGQSNMEMTLSGFNREPVLRSLDMIAKANNPEIRLLTVKKTFSNVRLNTFEGNWVESNHKTASVFSAVAYSFANYLNEVLDIPIGIILTSWGGTPAEAWTPSETLSRILTKEELNYNRKQSDDEPSVLFNAMINPLIPFNIRGAIWYQGEGNVGRAHNYTMLMNSMIQSWRDEWNIGDFPFYFVQIAPNGCCGNIGRSQQAFLREAQLKTMQTMKNTGMAVTLDIGSTLTIHPPEKILIGKRLAYWALAKDYGFDGLPHSGPVFKSLTIEGNKAYVDFDYAERGVTSYGKKLSGFEIAGEDKIFYKAQADIDPHWGAGWKRSTLVLMSEKVNEPKYIRYGWTNYIEGMLYNIQGLPASSFRTDN